MLAEIAKLSKFAFKFIFLMGLADTKYMQENK